MPEKEVGEAVKKVIEKRRVIGAKRQKKRKQERDIRQTAGADRGGCMTKKRVCTHEV
ncbi:hypothetical protein [Evansella clarkii]|uniref:hypothetical protein n=1 Tax=Evansella clarkii TaxID=79879 RepID=UPI001474A1BB|nr:hypothetical protein [Evansella clarkii]